MIAQPVVALIGLGKMGAAIARELHAAGIELHLWNRSERVATELAKDLNAEVITTPVRAFSTAGSALVDADFVICTLANGAVTYQILIEDESTVKDLKPSLIIADLGTSGVDVAKKLASALGERGIGFVDAPVSGSMATIASHQLLVMASGEKKNVDQITPILMHFAKKVAYLGEAGAGQVMKLAVNLIVHTLDAAVSESLALATKGGISSEAAYDVFDESVIAAPFVKYKRDAFLNANAPVAMRVDTVSKDLGLITGLGEELGLALSVTRAVQVLFAQAQAAGLAEKDMAELFRFLLKS
jgi:3-hydroxyisobutyrate dehydrogenase-like beta-hydroxyacid dehydrogenase